MAERGQGLASVVEPRTRENWNGVSSIVNWALTGDDFEPAVERYGVHEATEAELQLAPEVVSPVPSTSSASSTESRGNFVIRRPNARRRRDFTRRRLLMCARKLNFESVETVKIVKSKFKTRTNGLIK